MALACGVVAVGLVVWRGAKHLSSWYTAWVERRQVARFLREQPGGAEGGHVEGSCVVCWGRPQQVALLPCGHVCCCDVCSAALALCPLCRGPIERRVPLFRA